MVRELHLPHMESLVPDVAVVGCRGEERRESPLGKAGGAHVCDQGDHCPNAVGPALPVSGRASG